MNPDEFSSMRCLSSEGQTEGLGNVQQSDGLTAVGGSEQRQLFVFSQSVLNGLK
jgi:hypothetical protein